MIVREVSDPKVFLCTCKINITQNNYKAAVSVVWAMKMTAPGKSDMHSIVVARDMPKRYGKIAMGQRGFVLCSDMVG